MADKDESKNFKRLLEVVQALEEYGVKQNGKDFNPLDGSLRSFDGWDEITEAFIQFVSVKSAADWSKKETLTVNKIVHLDWSTLRLLKNVRGDELTRILKQPYKDITTLTYMVMRANKETDRDFRISILLHFFKSPDKSVRLQAFKYLGSSRWESIEEEAAKIWHSKDLTGDDSLRENALAKHSVLEALHGAKSPLLQKYLQEALASSNESLKLLAVGLNSIINIDESQWPEIRDSDHQH